MRLSRPALTSLRLAVLACVAIGGAGASRDAFAAPENGEVLLRRGAFTEAEAAFRRTLEATPGDARAADGLLRARRGGIDAALQKVRARRQSGDPEGAFQDFAGVVVQARAWGQGVPGGVGPLYEEEAAALIPFVDARLKRDVDGTRVLAARHWLSAHEDGFGDGTDGRKRYADRCGDLDELGARHCETLWRVASVRSPWFADFTARYCAAWNQVKSVPKALVDARNRERFDRIDLRGAVGGLTLAESEALTKSLRDALVQAPSHDADGSATLALSIRGVLVAVEQRSEEALQQPYALQVPYLALEEYCEWTQVPVSGTKWVDGKQVMVTEARNQCVSRAREVQKVRLEPQVLQFTGARVHQSFRVQLEAEATLLGRAVRASVSETLDESDVTHDVARPDIGLAPDLLTLMPRATWVSARFAALAAALLARLRDRWTAAYCVPVEGGLDLRAEQALRCLAATPDSPTAFVKDWAMHGFGMDVDELLKAVP
jgi:hypothetical protein